MPINNVRWELQEPDAIAYQPKAFCDGFSWQLDATGAVPTGTGFATSLPSFPVFSFELQASAANPTPVVVEIAVENKNGVASSLQAEIAPGGSYNLEPLPNIRAESIPNASLLDGLYTITGVTIDAGETKARFSVPNLTAYKFLFTGSHIDS